MEQNGEKKWFAAKKYGIGWGLPITWQGWLVFLIYIALILLGIFFLTVMNSSALILPFVFYVLLLTGVLFYICWKKGEKLDIRWGEKS